MTRQSDELDRVGIVVIHGVGGARPGWINSYLIPNLSRYDDTLPFVDHSEVHDLDEEEAQAPSEGQPSPAAPIRNQFAAYLRRTDTDAKPVAIVELFWADLSRVGYGPVTSFLSMMQLFYEAPLVLGAALMRETQRGLGKLVNTLVVIANWLVRAPITGLNATIFVAALAMLLLQKLREALPTLVFPKSFDVYYIGAVLAITVLIATLSARRSRSANKPIILTDLAASMAGFGACLVGAYLLGMLIVGPSAMNDPAPYLRWASFPILALWWLWSHLVVAAIFLLLAMYVWRLVTPRSWRRANLVRLSAALGLTTIQGMIWKILIAVTWVLLIGSLVPGSVNKSLCFESRQEACLYLYDLNSELIGVFLMNLAMAGVLGMAVLAVIGLRKLRVKARRKSKSLASVKMPRLIVNRWLMVLMFAQTLVNYTMFYMPKYASFLNARYGTSLDLEFDFIGIVRQQVLDSGFLAPFIGLSMLLVLLIVFRTAQNALRGTLHIVRDIVDHQYVPERMYQPSRPGRSKSVKLDQPRRDRIQKRFDRLMNRIVQHEHCQNLILVAHSQGTVILLDYLMSTEDDAALAKAKDLHIVTLGSPIDHIYKHYFPKYDASVDSADLLNPKLRSWTNIYRVDDPIGNKVEAISGGFITNIVLPAGGHVDYWKEERVCEVILDLVDPGRPSVQPKTTAQRV
ncbi:MAG: hypothetical protein ACT4N2_13555 [Hyphomicrobium sp.]